MHWFEGVLALRQACTRRRTFVWMTLVLVGFSIRADLLGVTSFVRACFIHAQKYRRVLYFFHSPALNLTKLTELWVKLVFRRFSPVSFYGYTVLVADGLKAPKEGQKMPAVKSLHQESANNSKASFIMGHSFQALGLLVQGPVGQFFCVPLVSRIHEGLVWSNRDKRTLLDKLAALFLEIVAYLPQKAILIADAYYASRKVIQPLLRQGHHLVTRVRITTRAYHPAPPAERPKPGRPRIYGKKGWLHFGSGLRTMHQDNAPSEMVVAQALRTCLPQFLVVKNRSHDLEKFIVENADLSRLPDLRLTA
jgi:hypothetical protein